MTTIPNHAARSVTLAAIMLVWTATVAWLLVPYVMIDLSNDYIPWYLHVVTAGPIGAFMRPFSNYTPPYLYLLALATPFHGLVADAVVIKLVGLAGHVLLALATFRLLRALRFQSAILGALAVFALPSLFANPILLGQCDALYAAPIVLALVAAVERRHGRMMLWCGLGLAVKLQAIFIAPVFLALLLARRVPVKQWLFAPAGYVVAFVPAWLAGWPIADLATIYSRQAAWVVQGPLNAPNLWTLVHLQGAGTMATWLPVAATGLALLAYLIVAVKRLDSADSAELIRLALLAVLVTVGLLPRMHERYFFLADLLALVLALARPDRDTILVAILIQLGSIGAIAAYVTGANEFAVIGSIAMVAATWVTARLHLASYDHPTILPTHLSK